MGVEQSRADEAPAEQRLHDVANGAVVRESNVLRCGHECAVAAVLWRQGLTLRHSIYLCILLIQVRAYLAQGFILRERPRLRQKPAPPVANQKRTCLCRQHTDTQAA